MKVKTAKIRMTARDYDLLTSLGWGPLTINQIMRHSARYSEPYRSYESLRRRLAQLGQAGYTKSWMYYVPAAGGVKYYKLSRSGFRILFFDSRLPSHSYFEEIKFANQNHSFALHEFVSKVAEDAWNAGYQILNFRRDRELKLEYDGQHLLPDGFFQLHGHGQTLNYFLEIDCGSEPVVSFKNREALSQKIRFYDEYSKQSETDFRVLTIFSGSPLRRSHFLDAVATYLSQPNNRSLFLTALLTTQEMVQDFVTDRVFLDHRRRSLALGFDTKKQNQ